MNANEAFEVLKLEKKFPVSKEDIKKAFREQAKLCHPDVGGSTEQMTKVNEAYKYLNENIDGINEYNLGKKKNDDKINHLDALADTFVNMYLAASSRETKRMLLETFLEKAALTKGTTSKWDFGGGDYADMLREMFKKKMNSK